MLRDSSRGGAFEISVMSDAELNESAKTFFLPIPTRLSNANNSFHIIYCKFCRARHFLFQSLYSALLLSFDPENCRHH
jgi:hypothetical protein